MSHVWNGYFYCSEHACKGNKATSNYMSIYNKNLDVDVQPEISLIYQIGKDVILLLLGCWLHLEKM